MTRSSNDILGDEQTAYQVSCLIKDVDTAGDKLESAPYFIYSCGWRSGSTLLQRALVSSNALVWGEPYAASAPVRSLVDFWKPLVEDLVPEGFFIDSERYRNGTIRPNQWLANLYPSRTDLLSAQRSFLTTLFEDPAVRGQKDHWGVKFVRLGAGHAAFMQMLFPKSKSFFLIRNPYDAYLSFITKISSSRNPHGWFHRWPQPPVRTASEFAQVWRGLVESVARYQSASNSVVIRYEDLVAGSVPDSVGPLFDLDQLERVGSSYSSQQPFLSKFEENEIKSVVGTIGERFGYFCPSSSAA